MVKWIKEKKIFLRLVSLILAVVLWLYITGVENPQDDITISNIIPTLTGEEILADRNLAIVSGKETSVTLRLTGRRSELIALEKESITIQADVSDIQTPGQIGHTYQIIGLPQGVSVRDQVPYSINILTEKIISKKVDVRIKNESTIAEGYIADEILAEPMMITVKGPESEITDVAYAEVLFSRENVSGSIVQFLPFALYNEQGEPIQSDSVSVDAQEIKVTLEISMIKNVPLVLNIVEGGGAGLQHLEYKVEPEFVSLSGDPSELEAINQIAIGTLDLATVTGPTTIDYPLVIPDGMTNMSGNGKASVSVSINGLKTKLLETDNIEFINRPEGMNVERITQMLRVMVRGSEASVDVVEAHNLRVVVDLAGLPTGQSSVIAQVHVDGFNDVGVVGRDYKVAVDIQSAPAE